MIAITVSDATRQLAELAATKLRTLGQAVELFTDGMAMEARVRAGDIHAVLELGLAEMIAYPHTDRLTAAAMAGIPQVLVLVGLQGTPTAMDALGKEIAQKASAAKGPTRVLVPRDVDVVLIESLRNWVYPPELIVECDTDPQSADFVEQLIGSLSVERKSIN